MPAQLFSPLTLRGIELPNRVVVAPMCQYSALDGSPGDWHMMHLGSYAISGAALVIIEATGVAAEGRITPYCTGLYSDENEAAFARILAACRQFGPARFGIQLAHAGRKGSTQEPWRGGDPLTGDAAWETEAPSALPYSPSWPMPRALDEAGLLRVKDAFAAAARRAARLGLEYVELHCAHGYLLHQFLSPLSNHRNDEWGGTLSGRMRFPLEVFDAVRAVLPDTIPLVVRISATDGVDGGWDLAQSIAFCEALKGHGCDAIHVTSGGLSPDQDLTPGPGYQLSFAAEIRRAVGLPVIGVGFITDPVQAETIVRSGQADMVALARQLLWDPRWVWRAAEALGGTVAPPAPYARCHPGPRITPFGTPHGL